MNNVITQARHRDPYYLVDFMVQWIGRKLAERQDVGTKLKENKSLLTVYADRMLGKREVYARESRFTMKKQGDEVYMVIHEYNEKGCTSTVSKRYHVDLKGKTCTCPFVRTHRLPCEHVIFVLDNLQLRDTPELRDTFRTEWVAPYFWSENYIDAYENECVLTPPWDESNKLNVAKGARVVTKPFMAIKNQRRNATKRKSKGEGGRRSRALFDPVQYRKRRRNNAGRTGPANPEVRISNPNIFHKKPCGRKPITYEERSEGSCQVRQRLMDVINQREKNPSHTGKSRSGNNRGSQVSTPHTPTTPIPIISTPTLGSTGVPLPSIPIISTPTLGSTDVPLPSIPIISTPTLGSTGVPLPSIPIISTPSFPTFGSMDVPIPIISTPTGGFPWILPNPFINGSF